MIVCRNLLVAGQASPRNIAVATNPNPWYFPEHRSWWADDVVYTIVVEKVIGAPTTATLTARFQVAQPTSKGLQGGSNYVDTVYTWADAPSDLWPVKVGDQTSADQLTVLRIAGGISHRLVLDSAFTGGATGTADTTAGSSTLQNVSAGLLAGMPITGAGIPADAYLVSKTGTTAVMASSTGGSVNATTTATGVTITASPAFIITVESKQRGR